MIQFPEAYRRARRGGFRLVAAAILAVSLPLAAEEGPTAADEEVSDSEQSAAEPRHRVDGDSIVVRGSLEEIPTSNTVLSKFPISSRRTPASVSVISSERLTERGDVILGDALEGVAGVNVQTGNGVFDFFVVRGLDSVSSSMILVDGAREPESSFYQMYNVERVEVLKGPSAFIYGGSPLAGSVNLVRRQPAAADFLHIGGSVGSFETYTGTLDANVANDEGTRSFRLGAMWSESDGYRDGRSSRTVGVSPSLAFEIGEKSLLNLSFELLDLDFNPDVGVPVLFGDVLADVPDERSYQSPLDRSSQQIARFQVDFETRPRDGMVVRDKLYFRALDWDSRASVFNGLFPGPTGALDVSRSMLDLNDEQRFIGNQLELLVDVETGSIRHRLLAGLEVAQLADEFVFDALFLPSINLDSPIETAVEPLFPIPGQQRRADAESLIVAPYLVDQIELSDRVDLFAGLRFDIIDFEDRVSGVSRSDEELSPMLGLVVEASETLSFYANAARAFAPPSTFAVAADQVPEESAQYEVGVKGVSAGGRVEATVAFYELTRENIAIPDATGVNRQTGDQRSRGVELEMTATPAPGWSVDVAYAYTDAELTEFSELVLVSFFLPPVLVDHSGNSPAFVPEHLLDVWASRRFDNGFGVALGGRWVSEQFIAEDNVFDLDSYTTVGGALFWNRGPLRLDLRLENLTDERYFTRGFGKTSVIPAPGATATTGFRYSF